MKITCNVYHVSQIDEAYHNYNIKAVETVCEELHNYIIDKSAFVHVSLHIDVIYRIIDVFLSYDHKEGGVVTIASGRFDEAEEVAERVKAYYEYTKMILSHKSPYVEG